MQTSNPIYIFVEIRGNSFVGEMVLFFIAYICRYFANKFSEYFFFTFTVLFFFEFIFLPLWDQSRYFSMLIMKMGPVRFEFYF